VSLADPVPDPVQAHVRGLGHTLGDSVGRNADGHLVVAEQRGCRLGVAHVGQEFAFLCHDAGSGVQASVLRLHDKGTDNRGAGGVAGDGAANTVIIVGEPEIAQATGDAACVRAGKEESDRTRSSILDARKIFRPSGCAATNPNRRWRRARVDRVGEACSDARAQVAGRTLYASAVVQQESDRHLELFGLCGAAEGGRSGPVGDWGAREPKTEGV
jgi:hypothetical protein